MYFAQQGRNLGAFCFMTTIKIFKTRMNIIILIIIIINISYELFHML